jgi:uncharacterized protein YeaO (DUF488 family)
MKISAKRAYEDVKPSDGYRVLVDRLWPRGVSKAEAKIDLWPKYVAPSSELRKWFHKDRESRFAEFSKRYRRELADTKSFAEFKAAIKGKKKITLVSATSDIEHSHVSVLLKKLS